MEINLHNYEAFFLDYKEGNLSHEGGKELFLFLEEHPHLYEELAAFENVVLDDLGLNETFTGKNKIKKTEFSEEDLIAYAEGIADTKSKKEIQTFALQNKELKKELAFYEATFLKPDLSIRYENKNALKKRGVVISLQNNYSFLRMAAAVLLVAGLFFLISNLISKDGKDEKVVAASEARARREGRGTRTEVRDEKIQEALEGNKQFAETKKEQGSKNQKMRVKNAGENIVKENLPEENKNMAGNFPSTVPETNNSTEEPVIVNNAIKHNGEENPTTVKSYYNYRPDEDENEKPVVTASAPPAKRSFFGKLVNAAKNVNKLGLKNVSASEVANTNAVSIGSFVVTETTSN